MSGDKTNKNDINTGSTEKNKKINAYENDMEIEKSNIAENSGKDEDNISEQGNRENIEQNKKETDIEKLLKDIQNSIKLNETLIKKNATGVSEADLSISQTLTTTLTTLTTINDIKEQLCLLPLDFCMRNYYNNCVMPLVATLDYLSRLSFNLSTSVGILTNSPIVPVKRSDIKDIIDVIYHINEQCGDVYKITSKRVDTMVNCTKCK